MFLNIFFVIIKLTADSPPLLIVPLMWTRNKKPQQRVADRLTMAVYAAGGETKTNRFLLCGGDTSSLLTNDGI